MKIRNVVFAIVFIALCFISRQAWDHSLWFVEDVKEEGYLSVDEMNVFDASGNKQVNISSPFFEYESYYADELEENQLYLPNGLSHTTTWTEFVSVFGDYYFDSINVVTYTEGNSCYYDEEELEDGQMLCPEYADSDFYHDVMTIREFDEQYVQSGIVDPDTQEINVTFFARYYKNQIYYDEDEYYDEAWKDMDSFLYGLKGEPRHGTIHYTVSFQAVKVSGQSGIHDVFISRYAY